MRNLITLILLTAAITLSSTTLTVKQDGSGDWTTIQSAVNASADGDTVLVWPGTYYENINFNGHGITIASLELTTGEDSYIGTTIVNGNQTGSCFLLNQEEQDAVIRGFTIINGSGYEEDNTINGGGVFIKTNIGYENRTNVSIKNCQIKYCGASVGGGGIYVKRAELFLSGVSIHDNSSVIGGGIVTPGFSLIEFDPNNRCNIYNNYAGSGVDIRITDIDQDIFCYLDTFTVNPPTQYFAKVHNSSVYNGELVFDVCEGWMVEVDHDLYVSPEGSDSNSGLTIDEPLQNISWALHKIASDSLNPNTVHIASGTYSRELTGLILPIVYKTDINIIGDEASPPVLFNDSGLAFISCTFDSKNVAIKNLILDNSCSTIGLVSTAYGNNIAFRDIEIMNGYGCEYYVANFYMINNGEWQNIVIHDNEADYHSGSRISGENVYMHNCRLNNNYSTGNGLYDVGCSHLSISMFGNALVENCTFSNGSNAATYGSTAISVSSMNDLEPHLTFRNNLIYNNTVSTDATVRLESRGGADIYNCTFVNNDADVAALQVEGYEVNIANCIFDNYSPKEITFHDWTSDPVETTVNIDHCNIKGGETGVFVPELDIYTLNWLEGNIDAPPDWAEYDPDNLFPYRLPDGDLSIDAGRADTTGMYLPIYDLIYHDRVIDGDQDGAARIDMGCYEHDPYPVAEEDIPRYESGLTNYPNPFNPSTTIRFTIPATSTVKIAIYNMRGQKIRDLAGITYQAGEYEIVWDGRNNRQSTVSSGVYICRMNYSGKTLYRKMLLMK